MIDRKFHQTQAPLLNYHYPLVFIPLLGASWSIFDPSPKTCVISSFVCPWSRWEDSQTCSVGCGHIPRISDSVVTQLDCEFCETGQLQSIQVCNVRTMNWATKSTKLGPYFPSPNELKLFLILVFTRQPKNTQRVPEREPTKDATSRTEHSANDRVDQLVESIQEKWPREDHPNASNDNCGGECSPTRAHAFDSTVSSDGGKPSLHLPMYISAHLCSSAILRSR